MNRLERVLTGLGKAGEKALSLFLTDGYPDLHGAPDIVRTLERGGADIIELGMPFSDPLADGPVIQESSTAALQNGVTLATVLEDVRTIRAGSEIPLVLMGYLNPILRYGPGRFFTDAASAGVDGVILPELPVEESWRFESSIKDAGLSHILLVTPTTPGPRIRTIDGASSGFVYCVSTTGVTGTRTQAAGEYLRRVRECVKRNPLLVGFGISTPEDAASMALESDGVIIGSALIRRLRDGARGEELRSWVRGIKEALRVPPPGARFAGSLSNPPGGRA